MNPSDRELQRRWKVEIITNGNVIFYQELEGKKDGKYFMMTGKDNKVFICEESFYRDGFLDCGSSINKEGYVVASFRGEKDKDGKETTKYEKRHIDPSRSCKWVVVTTDKSFSLQRLETLKELEEREKTFVQLDIKISLEYEQYVLESFTNHLCGLTRVKYLYNKDGILVSKTYEDEDGLDF